MNLLVRTLVATTFAATLTTISSVQAGNIDLSTVPSRDTVQLTIYNSEDLTLVRETRVVTFKKGLNPLQFSWANTLIDPSSVELRFLTSADQLEVMDTTFPHDKPQSLYWNVQSEIDGAASIEITYFTSGITWSADYVCIANPDESTVDIDGYVRVTNQSGEAYENAQVRLVVGTINLVEKIAQLAQIPMSDVSKLGKDKVEEFRRDAAHRAMSMGRAAGITELYADEAAPAPKEIIKEGLSEYFIYSIEGTETIPNGWSKRLRSFQGHDVPLKIQYRFRPGQYGEQLVRIYLMTNDEASKLGTTPLPDGTVRVFRDNGRDGLSYLTLQAIKYIPVGDKIELNLGVDPEVVFELVKQRVWRDNIWMQIHGTDKFQQVGENITQETVNSSVAGWDDHSRFAQRIRNYTGRPIDVEIRRTFDGHVDFRSRLDPKLHDFRTVELHAQVPAGERKDLEFEVLQHQGRNAKQSHVTLVDADVKRQ